MPISRPDMGNPIALLLWVVVLLVVLVILFKYVLPLIFG